MKASRTGLHSGTRRLPGVIDLLSIAPDRGPLVYLECPARGVALLASGIAVEIRAEGPRRFADAALRLRALLRDTDGETPGPIAIGGFAFEDATPRSARWRGFGSLSMVVPRRAWLRRGERTWQIDSEPDDTRSTGPMGVELEASPADVTLPAIEVETGDRAVWRERVTTALDAIASGSLRKVVLARRRTVAISSDLDPRRVIRRLRDERPACTTFWVRRGNQSFVGSSPELLARVEGRTVAAVALAGTAPGGDTAADVAAARALLACPKNEAEHRLVVAEIHDVLRAVCDELEVSERAVERVPEALHIATRFRGVLRDRLCALEVAGLLHPTSAVCGLPRRDARALIAATESERGWYAGGIGWVDGSGNGEFSVALRCGLLEPGRATLWAGAGIVAGSEPDAEYDETATKMQAMLRSLALAEGSTNAGMSDSARHDDMRHDDMRRDDMRRDGLRRADVRQEDALA